MLWIPEHNAMHSYDLRVEHRLQFGDAMSVWLAQRRSGDPVPDRSLPRRRRACPDLCALALQQHDVNAVQNGCHVAFHADTAVSVDVKYTCPVLTPGSGGGIE